jgi:glutamate synthase (NADPH/NADH) small chain
MSRNLELPGQTLSGVMDALDYLKKVNLSINHQEMAGEQVLVLGGGECAIDCARSAVRQMADKVTIIYRGNEQAMRASPKDLHIQPLQG